MARPGNMLENYISKLPFSLKFMEARRLNMYFYQLQMLASDFKVMQIKLSFTCLILSLTANTINYKFMYLK